MTKEQRDKILKLTKSNYNVLGNVFPDENDDLKLLEYLSESQHGDEIRSLRYAIDAHNLYCNDNLTVNDFFDWHGL